MKRIVLLIMLCACWVDDDIVMAQCVVNSGTPTYSDGTYLSAAVCDANGAVKISGGGGGTQYTEDAAHSSGDTGTLGLAVRRDANTTLADTTGDYAPLQVDANGNLKVNVIAGGGTGGVSVAEDTAHSAGENITPIGCRRIDTAATSTSTSGDWATVDCDANGALRVRIDSSAVGGVSNDDDNSVAYSDTNHTTVLNIPYVANGTTWERQRKFVYLEDDAHANQDTGAVILSRRIDTAASSAGASADYATVNTDALGLLWTRQLDPCSGVAKTYYVVNISSATTAEIVNGAGASNHVYICSVVLHTDAANDVAFVEDDTDACASPAAGIFGGTTTGAGFQLAASSGLAIGGGGNSIARTANTNYYVCLITSAATQLTGHIAYVIAP